MNTTGHEYDEPYTWGRRPDTYLSPREIVRLTLFRSRLSDRADLRKRVITPRRRHDATHVQAPTG
jgi:hypothetical protein